MKKTLITTPLYYASGNLHIGHLYSTNVAWVLRNYRRLIGEDAILVSGSDEHGSKIQQKAAEAQLDPQTYVDMIDTKFHELWKTYSIDIDIYERTSNDAHKKAVAKIFETMLKKQDIELKNYSAWYSVSDEEFVTLTNAIKENNEYFHPVSRNKLIEVDETNYFFLMNKYENWLKDYLTEDNLVYPKKTLNEMLNSFIEKGIEDLSVTREKVEWGIKTLNDEKQTIYVWLDALFGYLTALGYGSDNEKNFNKYWTNSDNRIHVMAKEISRFHLIYFPIFLQSLGLNLPTQFLVHGWLLSKGLKMSKSIGNVIDPYELLNTFEPEMVKYFFIAKIDPKYDGNVDHELIIDSINAELINNYGNLISRTLKMISNSFENGVKYSKPVIQEEIRIEKMIQDLPLAFDKSMAEFSFPHAFSKLTELSSTLNGYIDITKPWTLTENKPRLEKILNLLLNGIYAISVFYQIVLVKKMEEVEQALNIDLEISQISNFNKFDSVIPANSYMLWNRIKK